MNLNVICFSVQTQVSVSTPLGVVIVPKLVLYTYSQVWRFMYSSESMHSSEGAVIPDDLRCMLIDLPHVSLCFSADE